MAPQRAAVGRARADAADAARFLAEAQEAVGLHGQVTVLLTTDAAIRDLNRRFRAQEQADRRAFVSRRRFQTKATEKIAGDVAISVETARRQAAEQGHALTCELKVLILHGVLHLAGYDHETDKGRMQPPRARAARGAGAAGGADRAAAATEHRLSLKSVG